MKRILSLILVVFFTIGICSSCNSSKEEASAPANNQTDSIGNSTSLGDDESSITVTHDTMSPLINKNDVIIVERVSADDIATGDVIAFYDPASPSNAIITHRIVDIYEKDGVRYATTAGDKTCNDRYARDIKIIAGDDLEKKQYIMDQAKYMNDAKYNSEYVYILYEEGFDSKPLKLVDKNIVGRYTYKKIIPQS